MILALASGAFLGVSCGLAPGPLLALVLTQTLRHGPREGCKIALSPLVTDAPIIIVTLVLAAKLAQLRPLLGMVSVAGGAFILYLAWETFSAVRQEAATSAEPPRSWFKGILTNLLSPHPWLFWLTVGAASLAKALAESWLAALVFLFGFYLLLVGAKVMIALLAARSRDLLAGRPYRVAMRILALLLGVFALLLFREGLENLAVI
ncbi:MAG TPA: LysE family translocator [Verrucomicrobiota bacterium]|nr:LysE family translocator [Verrucomicrobiota bacterium]HQL77116.1 LysE family translocator [Verrucomicrobiota bacterium]